MLAAATGGAALPAVPASAVTGAAAGAATGLAIGRAIGNVFFSKSDSFNRKPGSQGQFKGRDALRRENNQVRDVAKELGLSKDQQRQLHDAISGRGLKFQQMRQEAIDMFNIQLP